MVKILRVTFGGIFRDILEVTIETEAEFAHAAYAGFVRHLDARASNRKRRDGTRATWDDDINGAIGEYIVSLGLRLPWRGPGKFRGDDVEGGFQVRTVLDNSRRLILHESDQDDKPYILVTGTPNHLVWRIPGWLYAKDGKKPHFKENPKGLLPSYYIDQQYLNPILELERG